MSIDKIPNEIPDEVPNEIHIEILILLPLETLKSLQNPMQLS